MITSEGLGASFFGRGLKRRVSGRRFAWGRGRKRSKGISKLISRKISKPKKAKKISGLVVALKRKSVKTIPTPVMQKELTAKTGILKSFMKASPAVKAKIIPKVEKAKEDIKKIKTELAIRSTGATVLPERKVIGMSIRKSVRALETPVLRQQLSAKTGLLGKFVSAPPAEKARLIPAARKVKGDIDRIKKELAVRSVYEDIPGVPNEPDSIYSGPVTGAYVTPGRLRPTAQPEDVVTIPPEKKPSIVPTAVKVGAGALLLKLLFF